MLEVQKPAARSPKCTFSGIVPIDLKRFLESGVTLVECPDCAATRTLEAHGKPRQNLGDNGVLDHLQQDSLDLLWFERGTSVLFEKDGAHGHRQPLGEVSTWWGFAVQVSRQTENDDSRDFEALGTDCFGLDVAGQ